MRKFFSTDSFHFQLRKLILFWVSRASSKGSQLIKFSCSLSDFTFLKVLISFIMYVLYMVFLLVIMTKNEKTLCSLIYSVFLCLTECWLLSIVRVSKTTKHNGSSSSFLLNFEQGSGREKLFYRITIKFCSLFCSVHQYLWLSVIFQRMAMILWTNEVLRKEIYKFTSDMA